MFRTLLSKSNLRAVFSASRALTKSKAFSTSPVTQARHLPVLRDPFFSVSPLGNAFRSMDKMMRDMESAFFRPSQFHFENAKEILEDFPEIKYTSKNFSVKLNVSKFATGDVKCELIDDGVLKVSAFSETKSNEHGYCKQEMVRQFSLPDDINQDTLKVDLSDDGILSITADVKQIEASGNGRPLKIERKSPSSNGESAMGEQSKEKST